MMLVAVVVAGCSSGQETAPSPETPAEEVASGPDTASDPSPESPLGASTSSTATPAPSNATDDELPSAVEIEPGTEDPAAEGHVLYVVAGCGGCHGSNAEGSKIGPALVGHTAEQVRRQTRAPLATMPSYSVGQLSDEDLDKIVAYIESLGPVATHVEPTELPELVAMHHWMALSAIRSGNIEDALHHVEHILDELTGDHLVAMEVILQQLAGGDIHDAEHGIEGMLAGTAEPELTLKQLHAELALAAIGNRNVPEAIHHVGHYVELAEGEEKADGEVVLAQLDAGDLHSARHGLEALIGLTPHG